MLKWLEDSLARRRWHKRFNELCAKADMRLDDVRELMTMLSCPVELAMDEDLEQTLHRCNAATPGWDRESVACRISMELTDFLRHREEQRKDAILDSLPSGTPRRCDAAGFEHKWWHVSQGGPLELPRWNGIVMGTTSMDFPPTDWTRRVCHRCGVKQRAINADGDYGDYEWEELDV